MSDIHDAIRWLYKENIPNDRLYEASIIAGKLSIKTLAKSKFPLPNHNDMAGLLDDFRQSISSWKAEYEKHQALFGADPRAHEIIPFLCASIEQQLPSDSEKRKSLRKQNTLGGKSFSYIRRN